MSLLNQVLQDLDARQPVERPRHLHLAEQPQTRPGPANDEVDTSGRQAWLRPGFWSVLLLTVLLAGWAFNRSWQLAANTGPGPTADLSSNILPVTMPAQQLNDAPVAGAPQAATEQVSGEAVSSPVAATTSPDDVLPEGGPVAQAQTSRPSMPVAAAEDTPPIAAASLLAERSPVLDGTPAEPVVQVTTASSSDAAHTSTIPVETVSVTPPLTPWQEYLLSLEPIDEPAEIDPGLRPPSHVDVVPQSAVGSDAEGYLPLRNAVLPQVRREAKQSVKPAMPSKSPAKMIRPLEPDPLDAVRRSIADGDLAQAESMLMQRLQVTRRDRIARELLIGLMVRGERVSDALGQLQLARELHPGHGTFVLIEARLLAQSGRIDAATALLQAKAGTGDDGEQRLQMLGALLQQQGQYDEAAGYYRALLVLQPGSATAWMGLALSLDATGDATSTDAYRRALQLDGLPTAAAAYARRRLTELE